ncbi:MAG: hypothetical protein QM723_09955 [Myxococcaceae bacterium]
MSFKLPGYPSLQRISEHESETGSAPPKDPFKGIRCPKCRWRPTKDSRWSCNRPWEGDICMYTWNTFDTRGLCQRCGHQWTHTMCLDCWQWSLHDDWYEK